MFVSEEPARPADARLHLVEDQEEAMPVADLAQAPQERAGNEPDPAFALDRLDHDGAGSRPDRSLDRREVGERDLVEAVDLGAEALKIFGLAAGGDHRERPAVESALESDRAIALGMAIDRLAPARHLHRRFVGFGARIGEEHQVGEGGVDQTARKALALGILIEVRNVPQLRTLAGQRFDQMRMGVADRGHGDAGAEIQIALAFLRHEPAALATLEDDIRAGIGRDDGRCRRDGVHLSNSLYRLEIPASRGRRCAPQNKKRRPAGAAAEWA